MSQDLLAYVYYFKMGVCNVPSFIFGGKGVKGREIINMNVFVLQFCFPYIDTGDRD